MLKTNKNIPFVGIGLVFGTGIGLILSLLLNINIYWAGIGTALGLLIGSVISMFAAKK